MEVTGYINTSVAFPHEQQSLIFIIIIFFFFFNRRYNPWWVLACLLILIQYDIYRHPIDCLGICVDERNTCRSGVEPSLLDGPGFISVFRLNEIWSVVLIPLSKNV